MLVRHRAEREALLDAQKKERNALAQKRTQEKPTKLLTPEFARAATQPAQGKETSDSPARTPPRQATREDIKQTAREIVKPVETEPAREEDRLAEAFRRAQKQKEKREQQKDRSRDPGRGMSR